MADHTSRALHRYALATALATFLLVVAGGLVTSTDSGLAVPDWPLSYGTWFPPMVGGIRYEHGHRMIAGFVGLLILALAVWTARSRARREARRLALAALGAVAIQALLGGLTVLLLLPPQISIAHACLGQAVFCLVVCVAASTSPGWPDHPVPLQGAVQRALPRLAGIVAVLAAVQLALGAVVRHTGYLLLPHIVVAALLVVHVVLLAARAARAASDAMGRELRPQVWRLTGLVCAQVVAGVVVYTHRTAVLPRTGHVALGALILAQAVVLAWEAGRRSGSGVSSIRAVPRPASA